MTAADPELAVAATLLPRAFAQNAATSCGSTQVNVMAAMLTVISSFLRVVPMVSRAPPRPTGTDEVARGFRLACQSYPVSDRVVVDFDQTGTGVE